MPNLIIERKSVHYVDRGEGVPIVLAHASAPVGHALWSKMADLLGEGCRLLMPDLWGFGQSDNWTDDAPIRHETQGAMLIALINAEVGGPVHLVGHSYGGASIISAALQDPRLVKSLTLIEPLLMPLLRNGRDDNLFNAYRNMAETFLKHAHAAREEAAWRCFVEYWNGPDAWENMSDKARSGLMAMTRSAIAIFPGNIENQIAVADLETINAPTQVICGEVTESRNRRVAEIVRDAIPNCSFIGVEGAGHMSVLSHPGEIAEAVRQHIDGVEHHT